MTTIQAGDKITGLTRGNRIGKGTVHTVCGDGRFFVQITLPNGARFNHYLTEADESVTWVRGHYDDVEAVKAMLAAQKLVDSASDDK